MSQTAVVEYWGCWAQTERAAAIAMSNPTTIPPAFVLAEFIDAIFAAQSQIDPETRREAWEGNWGMTRVEIEVDEEMVEGYFTNQQWCVLLWQCRQSGGCQQGDPLCLQLDFPNGP